MVDDCVVVAAIVDAGCVDVGAAVLVDNMVEVDDVVVLLEDVELVVGKIVVDAGCVTAVRPR